MRGGKGEGRDVFERSVRGAGRGKCLWGGVNGVIEK